MNSELLDKLPPSNIIAEQWVIGSILLDPKCLDSVMEIVQPGDFHAEANEKLYGHLLAMEAARVPLDSGLILERLRAAGDLEAVGGSAYLGEILHAVPHAGNAIHYAKIVRHQARLRKIIHAATEMLREAWEPDAKPETVLDDAERRLTAIRTNGSEKTLVDAPTATMRAMERIDAIFQRQRTAGIMTGLLEFDKLIGGLFPGELCILAARLKVGKTTLACQWADHVASTGKLVYFASLEMDSTELATKILCRLAGVQGMRVRNGSVDANDIANLMTASTAFSRRAMRFDERPRLRVSDIRRECRRLAKDGLRLIVVDYLQIVRAENLRDSRERQVASIAEDLKELARELQVPVLAMAQLNRVAQNESGGGAEGLRESDGIGQTADMVIRLDVSTNKATKVDEYWLRIVANRNGPAGKMRLSWDKELAVFDSWSEPSGQYGNREPAFYDYDGRGNENF